MVRLPRHICLNIEHQPHRICHYTVQEWLEVQDKLDACDIEPEDRAAMLATGEVWLIHWCPYTTVGSHTLAAATLERALALAGDDGYPQFEPGGAA